MSKINRDTLYEQVAEMVAASKDKNRKFTESVELQVRITKRRKHWAKPPLIFAKVDPTFIREVVKFNDYRQTQAYG